MVGAKVVVLILSIWNSETGTLLYEGTQQMPDFSVRNDRMEDCRIEGVERGKLLVAQYRVKFPYAFANVNCKWMPRSEYQDI